MEALTFSAYNFVGYPGYFPFYNGNGKFKPQNWNKKGNMGGMPEVNDYFELYKRAQLKAILSQVNPNLTPRLRKANTKDFGVQVNPKVSTAVQCSLGPKTLFYRDDKWGSPKAGGVPRENMPSTPLNSVRFSRPVAIYSPVFDRRFFSVPSHPADESENCEITESSGEKELKKFDNEKVRELEPRQQTSYQSPTNTKFNFQFLEQKYGYYHCGKCNVRWESAYVWCISGTCKVYFKQLCRKCQAGLNPYRVESIQCQVCAQTRCCCDRKLRHIDIRRPHRQDLCGRCKGKRLSCDTTYSFKYIV
ncbi:ZAR1-like protein [Trichomycterus rosablanca]|uniref:ZAR1-like protein n=1 Tax=Trichomycterus rosablanca TaxID=2290929 RepID=UPI002F351886